MIMPPRFSPVTAKPAKPSLIERNEVAGSPRERAEAEYRKAIEAVNLGRVNEALDGLRGGEVAIYRVF